MVNTWQRCHQPMTLTFKPRTRMSVHLCTWQSSMVGTCPSSLAIVVALLLMQHFLMVAWLIVAAHAPLQQSYTHAHHVRYAGTLNLAGHVDCARLLIAAQADVSVDCDGCPCLHLATCTGALAACESTALQLVSLLLEAGADPIQRWVVYTKALL